ncbi:unnamed protein product [Symbiodinium sp. CCMP2592]|nr:unnamed protein product [Symbiodinium sp. CCMP2592]
MGKAGKWAKQWPDKQAEQDYGWQDYSAYYKDAPARQPRRPREAQGPSFPQYDAMVIREHRNGRPENPPSTGPQSAGAGDFLRTVQKLTNNLRRAELRLRKCSEEQHQVNEKWEYREYSTKLQSDQEDAKQHQSAAIEELYKFLADPTQYKSTPTPDAPPKEALEEWERLMRGAEADGDDGLSGLLAGALGGAGAREQATKHMLEVLNAHRRGQQRERERTPPRRTSEALQMTPPAPTGHPRSHPVLPPDVGLENPDVAMRPKDEPYLPSPGSRHLLPSPGQRARTVHPRTPLKAQGRQPLQAPSTASSSLAAKLEGSREALRSEFPGPEEEKVDGEDQIIGNLRAASGPPGSQNIVPFGFGLPPRQCHYDGEYTMVVDDPRNAARLFRPVLTQQHAYFCGRQLLWGGPDKEQRTHVPLLPSISKPRAPPWPTATSFGTAIWWDILDVQHWALSSCWQRLQYFLIGCEQCGASLSLPFFLIVAIVEMIVLGAQMVWSRPFATQQRGKCFRAKWVYFVCPLAMCACTAHAVTPERPHGQVWWPARLPPPTDLELWCSGQLTVSEQLALALQRAIGERPLESQALWPDNIGREGPQPVPPPPLQREIAQEEPEPWLIDEDEEDTTHISFRLFSPHFESESIDISLTFPLVAEDVLDFLKDTARVITAPWLTTAAFTQPQLHNDYGSVVILPSWLRVSPQTVLVLDASEIGQGQFAFYHKGDLTRAHVLQQLEAIPDFAIEIFAFGRRTPMTETEALEPVLAGLIKVVRRGTLIQWASSIEPRLALRANWDPDTPHPDHVGGSHIAFQTSTDQKLHRVLRDDLFTPLGVASEIFDREQQQIWVRAPTIRPVGLYWKGRRVHSVIAVVDAFEHPPIDSYIVTLDLRGVGLWPIWVALQQNCFFPGDVIEALDIHFCQGFSLVVTGGRKGRTPGLLYIQDGDLLEASLRATADITPTQHEGGESEDDDEEESDNGDSDSTRDVLPSSDELPDAPFPTGPGHPASGVQPEIISLIDHFPKKDVECYSRTADLLTAVLSLCASHGPPHLRLYTDGSWLEKEGLGGFSVVVVLEVQNKCALFGAICAQTHGNVGSPWPQAGPPALRNEQFALASAMLWVFQSLPWIVFASITICYDCLAAGMAACGEWAPDCEMMQRIRHLQLWLVQVAGAPVAFEHVKAHNNHPMNELADCIAKAAAGGDLSGLAPPDEVVAFILENNLSWMAPALDPTQQQALPFQTGGSLQWEPEANFAAFQLRPSQLVPTTTKQIGRQTTATTSIEMVAISLNAQGLRDKCRYLEEQFTEETCHIAFLQETKMPEQDFYVVKESPRLLVVEVSVAGLRFVLFAAHCPHSGQKAAAAEFLSDLHSVLAPLKGAHVILGGIDLNGRPPESYEQVTGELLFGDPDDTGQAAVAIFHALGLWIPATFSQFHRGESHTYRHPQGHLHRLDFVVQGGKCAVHQVDSRVLYGLDVGGLADDHWAVRSAFAATIPQAGEQTRLWRPKYNLGKLTSKEGKAKVSEAMLAYRPPPWQTHPDEHCHHFTSYVQGILEEHFLKQPDDPRADYIPDKVWHLRQAKLDLKLRTRSRSNLWDSLLHRALLQWRHGVNMGVEKLLSKQGILYQLASTAVVYATSLIKKGIRTAKADYLKKFAAEGGSHPADILCHLKKAGLGGSKVRKPPRQLPLLLDPAGKPVKTRQERDLLWLRHFGKQELGQVETVHQFLARDNHPVFVDQDLHWQTTDLPSLTEIETVIRLAPKGRATGLDGIPSEILKAAPGPMSAALQSLFTKASLMLCQPLQWRGGILYECWKQSGKKSDPASHRSLFVSSTVGKCFHKVTRRKIQGLVNEGLHEFHMGARKGQPVLFPAADILSFLRRASSRGLSVGILFLDAEAAYYKICRELATGTIETDAVVVSILERFRIPPDDLHTLMQEVSEGGMMADLGVPPTIRHMAKDLHANTWFVSPHGDGSLLSRTSAGSRPGESWADVIFSFVFGRVLARITEVARGEQLLDSICADTSEGPFAAPGMGDEACASDATWADDSSWALTDRSPVRLLDKATRLCSVVLSQCQSYGLVPNLKPGKTALLLRLSGSGAKGARRNYFAHGRRTVRLQDVALDVQVTNHYKHLGGMVDDRGYGTCEAKRRLAIAATAFDKGKDLLYHNTTIPLSVRASILQVAVTSTLHNIALWTPTGPHWAQLCGGYARLVRRLLMKDVHSEALLHIPAVFAFVAAECPPLPLVATKARLSLLVSLAKTAPVALWAALQEEQSWLDLSWLCHGDEDRWPALGPAHWPQWRSLLCDAAVWFKRQVAKKVTAASAAYYKEQRVALSLWAIYRKAWEHLPDVHLQSTQHVCRPCAKTFRTKGALGAHFQKTHGRCAKYRSVVSGTICHSCGVQYWTVGRLARHLRDTPACVATLQANGATVDTLVPGIGSRLRRKADQEEYHPAPPTKVAEQVQRQGSEEWDAVQKAAHFALSQALQTEDLPTDAGEALCLIQKVLKEFPLYSDEAQAIVFELSNEISLVEDELLQESWTPAVSSAVRKAVDTFLSTEWEIGRDVEGPRVPPVTFETAMGETKGFDWVTILSQLDEKYGTRHASAFTLPPDWEAEWSRRSAEVSSSAVLERLWCWIPKVLQEAWAHFLNGGRVQLSGPADFWASPLAEPFRSFRCDVHTN